MNFRSSSYVLIDFSFLFKNVIRRYNGYVIMNSGDSNKTGKSKGKITLQEIMSRIPNARVLPEIPRTDLDNYVLVWNES